jgi:hypothetical protein
VTVTTHVIDPAALHAQRQALALGVLKARQRTQRRRVGALDRALELAIPRVERSAQRFVEDFASTITSKLLRTEMALHLLEMTFGGFGMRAAGIVAARLEGFGECDRVLALGGGDARRRLAHGPLSIGDVALSSGERARRLVDRLRAATIGQELAHGCSPVVGKVMRRSHGGRYTDRARRRSQAFIAAFGLLGNDSARGPAPRSAAVGCALSSRSLTTISTHSIDSSMIDGSGRRCPARRSLALETLRDLAPVVELGRSSHANFGLERGARERASDPLLERHEWRVAFAGRVGARSPTLERASADADRLCRVGDRRAVGEQRDETVGDVVVERGGASRQAGFCRCHRERFSRCFTRARVSRPRDDARADAPPPPARAARVVARAYAASVSDKFLRTHKVILLSVNDLWPGLTEPSGTLAWKVSEGQELPPHRAIATWTNPGAARSLGVDTFGTVQRLLVPDGAEVSRDEPIAEFDARLPTTEEYSNAWSLAYELEQRVRDLEEMLRNAFRAFWISLTRGHGAKWRTQVSKRVADLP